MIYYCSTEVIYLVKLFRQCIQQKWVKTTSPNPVKSVEKEKKIDFFQRIFIRTLDDSVPSINPFYKRTEQQLL